MPYRRLPNTDNARIRALKTAIDKCAGTDYRNVAIEMKTLQDAKNIIRQFERACEKYQQNFTTQVKANKIFRQKVKNARMYISHFVQVLRLSVIRAEIKSEHLSLYELESCNTLIPDLSSNELILEWGEKIIVGEEKRIAKGGVPIFNPTIAKVKVMFLLFKEGYQIQKIHQKATNKALEEIAALRDKVDKIILDIWDQVEHKNEKLPLIKRMEENKQYGVVYYYRKGETVEK